MTTMTSFKMMGYVVEARDVTDSPGQVAFDVYGSRGAHYGLIPTARDPRNLFAVNLRGGWVGEVVRLKGNGWFRHENGIVEPVS